MFLINGAKTAKERLLGKDYPKMAVLVLLILLCAGATYYFYFILRSEMVFSHLFYVPIVLAGFWWGKRGAWVAVLLGALLVASHLLSGLTPPLHCFLRAVMFVVVGLTVGILREGALRSEKNLRETRDYLDSLIRYANAPIIVWDPEGRITRFNAAFERLTGYTASEVIGQELHMLFPEASQDESLSKIARTSSSEYWEPVEIPILRQDRDIRLALWNSANIYAEDDTTLLATIAQGQDITERKRAEEEIKRSYQIQTVLNELLRISLGKISLEDMLERVIDHITSIPWLALESKGGIFLVEDDPEVLVMKAQRELPTSLQAVCARVPFGRCMCGRAALSGEIVFADCVDERHENQYEGISSHGHYCVPVLSAGKVLGVINLYVREGHRRDKREEEFLRAVADVLAGITERKRAEEELQRTLEKLREALGATIQAMAFTVETRDPYTAGHQRQVANLARAIATEMGLSKEQIEGIRMAGVIHDIGKITVPTDILNKPGRLTGNEFGIIKCHPKVGYDVLKTIEFPWPIAQIILQHHERMDGSGYPQGLSDDDILLEARILAVADVVEAMASFRPYRPPRGLDKALEEISQNRGVLYDPEVVDA